MNVPNLKNTLQQDLFLLAKGDYGRAVNLVETEVDRLTAAKLIVAAHVAIPPEYVTTDVLLYWLLEEFVRKDVLLKSREQLINFMREPVELNAVRGIVLYDVKVCVGLLDLICRMRIREGGVWICAVPECEMDETIIRILRSGDAIAKEREEEHRG